MAATKNTSDSAGYSRPVFLVDGARTPFLKAEGKPGPFSAADLAVNAGRALLARQTFRPEDLDEVILGCVIPAPDEANIGRVVSLRLGCGSAVPAWTVQRNCASGMQALATAAERIAIGSSQLILAGGTEAMSRAPVLWSSEMTGHLGAWQKAKSLRQKLQVFSQLRPRHLQPVIGLLQGLTDPSTGLMMGQTAEKLATRFAVDRQMMDEFSINSHRKLAAAIDGDRFDEIVPLFSVDGRAIKHDEGLRRDVSQERLSKLKPFFDRTYGRVTPANSSQVTDGAALLILAGEEAVERFNLPVLAQLIDTSWAGLPPEEMGLGPVYALDHLFQRHPDRCSEVDLWEINEAFAAQVLACLAALEDEAWQKDELGHKTVVPSIDPERLNVNGGAIAIGHPVGASGARIILHLANELKRRGGGLGVASLCIGGGQGGAMLLEVKGDSNG